MTFEQFLTSLTSSTPPPKISRALRALWFDRKGLWEEAHNTIEREEDGSCAAVHAYLHRTEGDIWNANYWYRKARKKPFQGSLDEEWEFLARHECEREAKSDQQSQALSSSQNG